MMRVALALLALLAVSGTARAQSAPQGQLQADATTVGVGEVVHLQLTASSPDTMPSEPLLTGTRGFTVRGPTSSQSQTHSFSNGSRSDRYTLIASWALEAQRTGTFHVGVSFVVGVPRYAAQSVDITVVAAGKAPQRRTAQPQLPPGFFQSPFGFSPFDPWKGLFQGRDDNQPPPPPTPVEVPTDPRLSLDAPRGARYFLHATVDKASAVVGEQVTFSVYEYIDMASEADLAASDMRDASTVDFAKRSLLGDDQEPPHVGYASIAGGTWKVRLRRRWALFPLRAGDLAIGPMQVTLARPQVLAGTQRLSEALFVRVAEPPLAGRPPGYAVGDVGHFAVSAQVSPRERRVEEGGAIAVHVEVSGTGNVPSTLAVPVREGVEWLAPETHEEVGVAAHDALGFKRTFDYVVRLRRPGPIDLGDLTLPFWNPDQRKYEIARAPLGSVQVSKSARPQEDPAERAQDVLPGLPVPRFALAASPAAHAHADDSPTFWMAGVGAWPLAFGVAVAGRAAGRRAAGVWRRRRASPAAELKQRLAAASAASGERDPRTVDAATARALEAAAVAHAGVSVRGALAGELVERLERAGVDHDAAACVAGLLRECEAARFSPEVADIVAARDRWLRAQGAIRGLERGG